MTTPTTAEQTCSVSVQEIREAIQSLRPTVKTRDVGRCQRCEGYTSSGMDAYCRECAFHVLRDGADAFDSARATIARLEGELNALRPVVQKNMPVAAQNISEIVTENHALRTRADAAERRVDDMTPLARLGEWVLERIRGVYAGDVDAFDVQDKATQFGVIAPQSAPRPCGECCVCEEMDADTCYRDTDATTRARTSLAAASGAADGAATREG